MSDGPLHHHAALSDIPRVSNPHLLSHTAGNRFPAILPPGYNAGMVVSPLWIFGVAFTAVYVWLGVRIYNRREKWAKWTAVAVAFAVGYPLSWGPWWYANRRWNGKLPIRETRVVFAPLEFALRYYVPQRMAEPYREYLQLWNLQAMRDDER